MRCRDGGAVEFLEDELQRELEVACAIRCAGDVTEGSGIEQRRTGRREVGVVEGVDGFRAELEPLGFGPRCAEILQNRQVDIPEAGAGKDVPVAGASRNGSGERAEGVVDVGEVLNGWSDSGIARGNLVDRLGDVCLSPDEDCGLRLREVDSERTRVDFKRATGESSDDAGDRPASEFYF